MLSKERRDFLWHFGGLAVLVFVAAFGAYSGSCAQPAPDASVGGPGSLADQDMARYTFWLLLVGAFQAAFFFWQLRLMQANVKDAKDAANVAKQSADAAVLNAVSTAASVDAAKLAERAYVKMSHHPPGLHVEEASGVCWVSLQVMNFGNTPARITDVSLSVKLLFNYEPFPSDPIYERTLIDEVFKVFLVTKDHVNYYPIPFNIGEERSPDLSIGRIKLWLTGYVDYMDMFGQRYRAGYARVYRSGADMRELYGPGPEGDKDFANRSNLEYVTQDGYNYDRPRAPGEGNDW